MPELRLAVTAGEPGGIGPDLLLALAQRDNPARCVVFADPELLRQRAEALGQAVPVVEYRPDAAPPPGALEVRPIPMQGEARPGVAEARFAPYVLESITEAGRSCLDGTFDALVTGPVQKSTLLDAGLRFRGHTEYLAEQASVSPVLPLNTKVDGGRVEISPVMLLVSGDLRVALATTHLPLSEVPAAVTRASLTRTLEVLCNGLQTRFGILEPRIRVLGLNPHAGEEGHFGHEEQEVIAPVIQERNEYWRPVEGPVSADTAFVNRDGVDAFLAMYHDQGLPVLKTLGFGHAVNVTLGLPYVRTSVDHGTALDLAGTGRADPGSLFEAVDCAAQQARMARCLWVIEFENGGDDRFVAYGHDKWHMPVYSISSDSHRRSGSMYCPSCLKFMPYADGTAMELMSPEDIIRKYGLPLGRSEHDPRELGEKLPEHIERLLEERDAESIDG